MTTHPMTPLQNYLIGLGACQAAVDWSEPYATLRDAWDACERGDWLLWLAARTLPREQVVYAACQVARTALPYVPEGEDRPRRCIEVTEAWTRGEATLDEVHLARRAAEAARAAADAACAAVYAADAADAACAAVYAACAADAACTTVSIHAADACAEIVRKHLQCPDPS